MKMSITRALVELKLLGTRITNAIEMIEPVAIVTGKNSPRGYKSEEEFVNKAKSNFSSATDLIKRRNNIKSAIVKANATTEVVIDGKTMTVAAAIERKNSIEFEKVLLSRIKSAYANAVRMQETLDLKCQDQLQKLLEVNFGKDSKAKPEEYDNISKPFLENNSPKMIDPLNAKDQILQLENDILKFLGEVDVVLSESNAKVEIEVE